MNNGKHRRKLLWIFLIFFIALVSFMLFAFDLFFSKVKLDTTIVPKVKELSVSQGLEANLIRIQWEGVNEATHYTIYRSTKADKDFIAYQQLIRDNFFDDLVVQGGQRYFYKIVTHTQKYKSDFSEVRSGYAALKPPKVIATNGRKGFINVSWNEDEAGFVYELFRSSKDHKDWQLLASDVNQPFYIDKAVQAGQNYYYKVRAIKHGRVSHFSNHDRGFSALPQVQKLQASDGKYMSHIKISWHKVAHAKSYTLYRAIQKNGPFRPLKANIKQNFYNDTDAIAGNYYYYKVKAFHDNASIFSDIDHGFIALPVPTRVQATDAAHKRIIISWEQHVHDSVADLYRSDHPSKDFKRIAKDLTQEYYEDTQIESARTYYYKVQAKKAGFISALSMQDSGYTTVGYPTTLVASDGVSPYTISLSWQSPSVDYFKVFRSESAQGPYTLIASRYRSKKFVDQNISYCKDYYYKVQSVKYGKPSRISSWASGYGKCGAFVETFLGSGVLGDTDSDQRHLASFNRPTAVQWSKHALYIADTFNHRIRKHTAHQTLTLAGSGSVGSMDAKRLAAHFYRPTGIAVAHDGTLYVAEVDNHLIRKITPQGAVVTLAGSGKAGDVDGIGSKAWFNKPYNLVLDHEGNLLVTELGNHKIRKVTPQGKVTSFAGAAQAGKRDGSLGFARFHAPAGIAIAASGRIYIADSLNHQIRMIENNRVTLFAGSGKIGSTDGKGVAAAFNHPLGLAVDAAGNLYVADSGNHQIRMISPKGIVKTIAGSLAGGDKDGFETDAAFFSPRGITVDHQGVIYVSDFHAHKIKKIVIRKR